MIPGIQDHRSLKLMLAARVSCYGASKRATQESQYTAFGSQYSLRYALFRVLAALCASIECEKVASA